MKKTVFVVPGFRQKPQNKAYRKLIRTIKREGYYPISITIPWNKTTISENTEQFVKKYKSIKRKRKYIIGFSYGAMIAFLAATKVRTTGLILCSLSPYFREDLPKNDYFKANSILKTRYEDFSKLRSSLLAKKIKSKQLVMLYGDKEAKPLVRRVTKTFRQIPTKRKSLLQIKRVEHDIANTHYQSAIQKAIRILS